MKKLIIIELRGGDPNGLGAEAIWTDTEGDTWRVLCADLDTAASVERNTGAELVEVSIWEGLAFGDGNSGAIYSPEPGLIVAQYPEFCDPPAGWKVVSLDNTPCVDVVIAHDSIGGSVTDQDIDDLKNAVFDALSDAYPGAEVRVTDNPIAGSRSVVGFLNDHETLRAVEAIEQNAWERWLSGQ